MASCVMRIKKNSLQKEATWAHDKKEKLIVKITQNYNVTQLMAVLQTDTKLDK